MPPGVIKPHSILDYVPRNAPGVALFDEMLDSAGQIRPHWKNVAHTLVQMGVGDLEVRASQSRRILHDNGVAYNVYTDPEGTQRPWQFDPVPLCLSASEWKGIETALIQRAELFNHILSDVYGPQDLLAEGALPLALVYANNGYLRPAVRVPVPGERRLVLYAADIARSPNGRWWVIADRTQAPSGMGYALENRIVMSRIFPERFRTGEIRRLSDFFQTQHQTLAELSPKSEGEPRVVLLTPGPYNETYFEHAYMARYLGYPLVQGADLMVRDTKVFVKTLGGLQQVDVILRRVDDDYCDPLELRSDSLLGVPGLLHAIRSGNVTVANPLGSSLVQCPALRAFLPGLCRKLLKQELLMPSIATWWCGHASEREYVLKNLGDLIVQKAFDHPGAVIDRQKLSNEQLARLIKEQGEFYAAQEDVILSQAPVYHEGKLEPRSTVLRVFLAYANGSYYVMPGALARVAQEASGHAVTSMQQGGGSKDTWVEAEPGSQPPTAAIQSAPVELRRGGSDLPSRMADNLYWLGRYAERAEFTARLFRAIVNRATLEQSAEDFADTIPAARTLGAFAQFQWGAALASNRNIAESGWLMAIYDPHAPGSLRSTVARLYKIATMLRDRISNDTWRILNQLHDDLSLSSSPRSTSETLLSLNSIIISLSAFNGMANENMTRGPGWRFLDLGRRLERSTYSARAILETLNDTNHPTLGSFEVLLEIFDTTITYRSKYFGIHAEAILDLVLADEDNPRSLASQLVRMLDHLAELPREDAAGYKLPEERLILRALSEIRLVDFGLRTDSFNGLRGLLRQIENAIKECSDLITVRYFTHVRTFSADRNMPPPLPAAV